MKKLRYCEYLGRYFCDCCHGGSEAVIPARVLSCWDFNRFPVSDFSKQLLDSVWFLPLFDLSCVCKQLCSRVRELLRLRELLDQLLGVRKLLKTCRLSERVMTEMEQLPSHLLQQPPLLSMDDLLRLRKGQLGAQVKAVLHAAISHVEDCELCLARGFICEFCREGNVLFPFQSDACSRCPGGPGSDLSRALLVHCSVHLSVRPLLAGISIAAVIIPISPLLTSKNDLTPQSDMSSTLPTQHSSLAESALAVSDFSWWASWTASCRERSEDTVVLLVLLACAVPAPAALRDRRLPSRAVVAKFCTRCLGSSWWLVAQVPRRRDETCQSTAVTLQLSVSVSSEGPELKDACQDARVASYLQNGFKKEKQSVERQETGHENKILIVVYRSHWSAPCLSLPSSALQHLAVDVPTCSPVWVWRQSEPDNLLAS
ncbi:unnamed protein product [Pleuronectes platessa]|uniref:Rubicon Homology domain-containing protein n=1 Tax=Pleuronectes platessa TaxID=8262 RepID=A0A9N7TTG7_PLEPL|nr:unnamed protein product [Pleuronectes platessa]